MRILRQLIPIIAVALVMVTVRASFADHYIVPTGSMEPTVVPGDRILVNKVAYGFRLPFAGSYLVHAEGPQRGHVVVLAAPDADDTLLKRVVAVAGDTVTVRGGHVFIDGAAVAVVAVQSRYLGPALLEDNGAGAHPVRFSHGGGSDFGPTRVPDGHVLVMGDNRGRSHDGRAFGFAPIDAIHGRAVGVFWSDDGLTWHDL